MGRAFPGLVALMLCSCVSSRFALLDEAFEGKPTAAAPEVLKRPLAMAGYRVVGLVEVFHANTTGGASIVKAARREGQKRGCEVLFYIEEADDGRLSYAGNASVYMGEGFFGEGHHGGGGPAQTEVENRARFLCAAGSQPSVPAPPMAPAPL
jgi:hypothetical protein